MKISRAKGVMFGTFVLVVMFSSFFIWPNYSNARRSMTKAIEHEMRVEQLERRQLEVEQLRSDLLDVEKRVLESCKHVPKSSEIAHIIQALSLEVDGYQVLDQSFTAGSSIRDQTDHVGFSLHPLAISMLSDFESIISVLATAESMNRLLEVTSVRIVRQEEDADITLPFLDASIGLHVMYDKEAP